MKSSFCTSALFLSLYCGGAVLAQYPNNCEGTKDYNCPAPFKGSGKEDQYESELIKHISIDSTTKTAEDEIWETVEATADLALSIASEFISVLGPATAMMDFLFSFAGGKDEIEVLAEEMEEKMNTIVDQMNIEIGKLGKKIEHKFNQAIAYATNQDYLTSVKLRRHNLMTALKEFSRRLDQIDKDDTFEDFTPQMQIYMGSNVEAATKECRAYFGILNSRPSGDFDDPEIAAKFRLVYAPDMCNGCLSAYTVASILLGGDEAVRSDYVRYLVFTMKRCMIDVIPLSRQDVVDDTKLLQTKGNSGIYNGQYSGTYDGSAYFWFYDQGMTGKREVPLTYNPPFEPVGFFKTYCYPTCDRIKSCTTSEFQLFIEYMCAKRTGTALKSGNQRETVVGCHGVDSGGANSQELAEACVAFGKQQLDTDLMNYYRSKMIFGYGDVWARSLAEISKQGLVASHYPPRTEGPFVLMSRYFGMFVDLQQGQMPTLVTGISKAMPFYLQHHEKNRYSISPRDGTNNLCDKDNCEWDINAMKFENSLDKDPTLFFISNSITKTLLSAPLDGEYRAENSGKYYKDSPTIELDFLDYYHAERLVLSTFRLIRAVCPEGMCTECTLNTDCSKDFRHVTETQGEAFCHEGLCKQCYDNLDCSFVQVCNLSTWTCESPRSYLSWLCMSGDKGVARFVEDKRQMTTVKELSVGDVILGVDENRKRAKCTVTAIGKYKPADMYGGYTADHSVFSTREDRMVQHGEKGRMTNEDSYEVLTDCPLGEDENGVLFAGFGHCGKGSLSWSDYLTIYDAISTLVEGSDVDFFSPATYVDMDIITRKKEEMCDLILACDEADDEEGVACIELEIYLDFTLDNEVKEESSKKAIRQRFPDLGKPGKDGSAGKAFTNKRRARKNKGKKDDGKKDDGKNREGKKSDGKKDDGKSKEGKTNKGKSKGEEEDED